MSEEESDRQELERLAAFINRDPRKRAPVEYPGRDIQIENVHTDDDKWQICIYQISTDEEVNIPKEELRNLIERLEKIAQVFKV